MDQEIASVINRALFHQQAPPHDRIMNARRYAKRAITAVTHQISTAEMALKCCNIIIPAARTVGKGVIDAKENEPWERHKIHAVPLVWYMSKDTQGLQKMHEEFEVEIRGIAIPTKV
jgi:hypothetical protein